MATIVEMINPLTGLPEQVDKLDHTAQEIDDAVGRSLPGAAIDAAIQAKPNPNLLDNWCFANPVNQRGSKSYVGSASVGIDRWWQQYNTDITVQDGYITASGEWQIEQRFENPIDVTDITISLLSRNCTSKFQAGLKFEDGTESGRQEIGISESAFALKTVTFKQVTKKVAAFSLSFVGNAGSIDLLAAKLELGSQQTLAHQDADGNWVPNEIPDYGEQLARCQRYYQLYSAAEQRPAKAVDCRPTMRVDPSQGTITIDGTTYYYNTADL